MGLMDCESEGCLQSEGGKERELERSVVMVMLTRNPKSFRFR